MCRLRYVFVVPAIERRDIVDYGYEEGGGVSRIREVSPRDQLGWNREFLRPCTSCRPASSDLGRRQQDGVHLQEY